MISGRDPAGQAGGGCLCGRVRFRVSGPPGWNGLCHCNSCRRATGGILVAACGYRRTQIDLPRDAMTFHASSPGVRRGFCPNCGTSISYENERWPEDIHIMAGCLDAPALLQPQFHIFAGERLPWLQLADTLPRFRTTPSAGDRMDGQIESGSIIPDLAGR